MLIKNFYLILIVLIIFFFFSPEIKERDIKDVFSHSEPLFPVRLAVPFAQISRLPFISKKSRFPFRFPVTASSRVALFRLGEHLAIEDFRVARACASVFSDLKTFFAS